MFYAGATPWHGLGTALPANAQWSDIASMFPRVDERPLVMAGGGVIPDMKALVCSSDGRYLATVGADYCVVQAETIAKAITVAALDAGAVFHTGGLLGARGARGWLMGELPAASFTVSGDNSPIKAFFSGIWGHDGRTSVQLLNNATRIVCANTVAAALGETGGFKVSIRHTSGAGDAVIEAGEQFAALTQASRKLQTFAEVAAQTRTSREVVQDALNELFPVITGGKPSTTLDASNARAEASQAKVIELLQGPTVAPAHRGTAWGLMQAMSEFDQHFTSRMTDAAKQVDAIATRQIDGAMMADLAHVYATVARVSGLSLPR